MSLGDVSLACTSLLVEELVRGGMRHACVSPGSRSTAIALALERDPRVTVHVHLDERSSAFFALGIAKATRAPVAVACTSGTAAAELFPAVVEASQARVPLVLLTADRPPRLRGTGANQTIDQVEPYGKYVRAFVDVPLPVEPVPVGPLRALVRDAFRRAVQPEGPIHLNLPFEEPLAPEGASVAEDWSGIEEEVPRPSDFRRPVEEAEEVAREVTRRRGAVVIGSVLDGVPQVTLWVAEKLRWPVVAEPTSFGRVPGLALAAGQALLGSERWVASHRPEVLIQLGATPTTRATQGFVSSAERLIVIDVHHPEPDPEGRATLRIREHPELVADELIGRPFGGPNQPIPSYRKASDRQPSCEEMIARLIEPAPDGWLDDWREADAVARGTIDELLDSLEEPYEGRVARDLATAIPDGGTLVVGSSMPIRDLDYCMAPREGLRVLANRGASGIDGFVSTALGVAAAGSPTYALMGDLTFLHDIGALFWNSRGGVDAVLVVNNNCGGTIFGFLPQRELPEFERLFETPHGLDLGAVCAAADAGHTLIERAGDLLPAIESARSGSGVQVVEVLVDPELNRARHAEVQATVDSALRDLS